jgi:hypothetical protein
MLVVLSYSNRQFCRIHHFAKVLTRCSRASSNTSYELKIRSNATECTGIIHILHLDVPCRRETRELPFSRKVERGPQAMGQRFRFQTYQFATDNWSSTTKDVGTRNRAESFSWFVFVLAIFVLFCCWIFLGLLDEIASFLFCRHVAENRSDRIWSILCLICLFCLSSIFENATLAPKFWSAPPISFHITLEESNGTLLKEAIRLNIANKRHLLPFPKL